MGTYLYKFSDSDVFYYRTYRDRTTRRYFQDERNIEAVSNYWARISDLYNLLFYAKSSGISLLELVRQRSAVLHNWNGLNSLLIIRLKQRVIGLEGEIGPQTEKNYGNWKKRHGFTKPIELWGGSGQVVIPNLTRKYVEVVVPAETIYIRDPVDDIIDFLKGFPEIN